MSKELQTLNTNKNTLDSREVAEMMGKEHSYVLREIDGSKDGKTVGIIPTLEKANFALSNYFILSSYKSGTREYKCYLVTKMGCEMLGNKLQGEKGILFTAKYVERFNQMEEQIKNNKPQISEKDKLLLNLFSDDPMVVSASHKKLVALEVEEATTPLLETIEEQAPKVDKYTQFLETDGAITFENVAKIISTKASEDGECFSFSRITLPRYLREHNILVKTKKGSKYLNTPRKEYEKYFNVSLTTHNKYGEELPNPSLQTRVKPIGIDFIYDFVKENGAD